MEKEIAPESPRSVVIDTASTICHITHNERFYLTEPTLQYVNIYDK